MPPSVTTSARFFISIGVTEVIGSTPSTFDLRQLLDEGQHGVELALEMLDLVLGDRDARQMRNTADGGGVDGHEGSSDRPVGRMGEPIAEPVSGRQPPHDRLRARPRIARTAGTSNIACHGRHQPLRHPHLRQPDPAACRRDRLKVRDLDRLTAFYRDVLGLAVLDRTEGRRSARRRRRAVRAS